MNMKFPRKFIAFLLIAFSTSVFAETAHELFAKANLLYQQGDFSQAVQLYEKILQNGNVSGELYFNLGNAYYKLGKIGRARLNYERALIRLENDPDLKENLKLVKSRLVDQIQPPPRLFLAVWWDYLINLFEYNTFAYIVLLLFIVMLVLGALFLHYKRRGAVKFKGLLITSIIVWLFYMTLLINKIYRLETEKYAIILSSSVTVYAEPAKNTTELFVLHEGTRVQVTRNSNSWYEIKLIDGKTGWLAKSNLEII